MNFPKYVKCKTLPDENGIVCEEWVVRLMDRTMDDESGKKIPTPENWLNRYYTVKAPYSKGKTIFSAREDKSKAYMTYQEIQKFKCKSNIEVD